MKTIKSFISITIIAAFLFLTGCSGKQVTPTIVPDLTQVKSICELAVLECYYHNVAKSVKEKNGFGTKERKFWIEYTGIVKIGIDMSKVKMDIDATDPTIITIKIPEAKVLEINVDDNSLNADSYITENDGIFSNKITAEDQSSAIKEAQKAMKETAEKDSSLLQVAQNRAKKLIENYINQLGEACDVTYTINWEDASDTAAVQTTAAETSK